jgi:hypothetical protein
VFTAATGHFAGVEIWDGAPPTATCQCQLTEKWFGRTMPSPLAYEISRS